MTWFGRRRRRPEAPPPSETDESGAPSVDDDVLEELSDAFGADDEAAPERRTDLPTISIGGGDELPDPVYLDDELGGTSTVFIEDDGSGDALSVEAAGAPIEPRLRQRRIGVKRAAGRRRLRWLAIGTAIVVVVIGILAVAGSAIFSVETVEVTGAVYTDPERLQEVVDTIEGEPILLVDADAAERDLEAIPWVANARVRTHLPDRVSVELRERVPVASMVGADGSFRVIDAEGRILDVLDGEPIALARITGVGTLDGAPGAFAPIGPSAAGSLVTKLTPEIRSRLDSILVTPDGTDLRLVLANGGQPPIEVRFGSALGDSEQIEKLVRLTRQLDDLGDEPITVIDVSTAEVTVR